VPQSAVQANPSCSWQVCWRPKCELGTQSLDKCTVSCLVFTPAGRPACASRSHPSRRLRTAASLLTGGCCTRVASVVALEDRATLGECCSTATDSLGPSESCAAHEPIIIKYTHQGSLMLYPVCSALAFAVQRLARLDAFTKVNTAVAHLQTALTCQGMPFRGLICAITAAQAPCVLLLRVGHILVC
jgi:hypothetical protein